MKVVKVSALAMDRTEIHLPFKFHIWICSEYVAFKRQRYDWLGYYVTISRRRKTGTRQAGCKCDIKLLAFIGALHRFIFKSSFYRREEE